MYVLPQYPASPVALYQQYLLELALRTFFLRIGLIFAGYDYKIRGRGHVSNVDVIQKALHRLLMCCILK